MWDQFRAIIQSTDIFHLGEAEPFISKDVAIMVLRYQEWWATVCCRVLTDLLHSVYSLDFRNAGIILLRERKTITPALTVLYDLKETV